MASKKRFLSEFENWCVFGFPYWHEDLKRMTASILMKRKPNFDLNDYGLEMFEAFLTAKRNFKPGKGSKFSTYLMNSLRWRLIDRWEYERTQHAIGISCESEIFDEDDCINNHYGDNDPEDNEFFDLITDGFSDREKKIISLKVQGYKSREIASQVNVTAGTINHHILPKIRKKIRNRLKRYKSI